MPNSPLEIQERDLGVRSEAPKNAFDPRVRLATEDALQSLITMRGIRNSRTPHWLTPVQYTVEPGRRITIRGNFFSGIHPEPIELDTAIILPQLVNQQDVVKRSDRIYLVNIGCIVGAAQDENLGRVSFSYKDRSDPENPKLVPTEKENARRFRSIWLLVVTSSELNSETFEAILPEQILAETEEPRLDGDRFLAITDTSEVGQALGAFWIYARDPSLIPANYEVVKDFVEVAEIVQVQRIQNSIERGFTYGSNGESPLDIFSIAPVARPPIRDVGAAVQDRLFEIFAGNPGIGSTRLRTVQNLTAGLVGGNPGRAGEGAASPSGSPAIGNAGRVTFTNQRFTEDRAAQIVLVQNDGATGSPVLSVNLPGNSPAGTVFSQRPEDHKIYGPDGVEQSALGQFLNAGNSLTWLGTPNASLQAGQLAYVVPAIDYPAGSGFSVPFQDVENVWVNGVPLSIENIRYGEEDGARADILAYESPANNEDFFAVVGRERAALHYMLQKVSLTSDASGVLTVPGGANDNSGCFAYIEGFPATEGPLDAPLVSGLTPNTTYNALIYYLPTLTDPVQLQMLYTPYQGTGAVEEAWLNDATVTSEPVCYITTMGGGNSVFSGDARIRYSPIAMHLPAVSLDEMDVPYYQLDAPMQLFGEAYNGPMVLRGIDPLPGSGLSLPSPGARLSFASNVGLGSGRSINGRLLADGGLIGCRSPLLEGGKPFLIVLAFMASKDGNDRLIVMSRTTTGNQDIPCDSSLQTGFDMFRV